jgi:protease I
MRMQMTRPASYASRLRALIVTADKFEDTEVIVPYFRLLEAGARVDIAAPSREWIGGEHRYFLAPDLVIDAVDPAQYDLLIIPGGFPDGAPATVRDHAKARAITRAFAADRKPIASICHGPWLLAAADAVRGRRLTSYWHDGVPDAVTAAGGTWQDAEVVVDGNLVTSRWPPDLPAFTRATLTVADAYLAARR